MAGGWKGERRTLLCMRRSMRAAAPGRNREMLRAGCWAGRAVRRPARRPSTDSERGWWMTTDRFDLQSCAAGFAGASAWAAPGRSIPADVDGDKRM